MQKEAKPYYQDDHGVIYNADCLKIMKQLPNESVDMILTDPMWFGLIKEGE